MAFINRHFTKLAIEIPDFYINPYTPVPYLDHFTKTLATTYNPAPTLTTLNRIARELKLPPSVVLTYLPIPGGSLSDILGTTIFLLTKPGNVLLAKNYLNIAELVNRKWFNPEKITALVVQYDPQLLASVGKALPLTQLRIVDPERALSTVSSPAMQNLPRLLFINPQRRIFPSIIPEIEAEVLNRYRGIYQMREKLGPYRNLDISLPPENTPVEKLLYYISRLRRGGR